MPVFQTPDPIAVAVAVLSADVLVHATDRTDTVVDIRPADESKKGDIRAAEQTRVDFTGGVLTVTTPKDWRTHTPFGGNPTIAVTIEVPAGSQLKSTAGVGRIAATGELGRCDLEIAAGDITVERAGDSVTAKVAKGDIRIGEAVRGELRLERPWGNWRSGSAPAARSGWRSMPCRAVCTTRWDPLTARSPKRKPCACTPGIPTGISPSGTPRPPEPARGRTCPAEPANQPRGPPPGGPGGVAGPTRRGWGGGP
ncbi:hypothetical protein [Nocardia carnea]|uniref:hypothetical protein n=1 Tax=Nocardia carnea TaxID=37328 RepID=UPI0024546D59|nr:hypothetical protein [Nocardia carnea]